MRIMNNMALGTLLNVLPQNQIITIKYRCDGYWKNIIMSGDLFTVSDQCKNLKTYKVNAIIAEDDTIIIGIDPHVRS